MQYLIDTDNRFGNTGTSAHPNYVIVNPGFEVEIELATNFGVRLYNVDGLTTPTLLTTLPYEDYAQKGIIPPTAGMRITSTTFTFPSLSLPPLFLPRPSGWWPIQ